MDLSDIKRDAKTNQDFLHKIHDLLSVKVIKVKELSRKIFEIIVYAPLAAKNFKPGQFYKLQNFASNPKQKNMQIEPIALTGAMVKKSFPANIKS